MKRLLLLLCLLSAYTSHAQYDVISYLNPLGNSPTHIDIFGKGGYMSVSDSNQRNAIPTGRRRVGMMVTDSTLGYTWILQGGTANANWTRFTAGMSIDGVSPTDRYLFDTSTSLSLDWNARQLYMNDSTVFLDWKIGSFPLLSGLDSSILGVDAAGVPFRMPAEMLSAYQIDSICQAICDSVATAHDWLLTDRTMTRDVTLRANSLYGIGIEDLPWFYMYTVDGSTISIDQDAQLKGDRDADVIAGKSANIQADSIITILSVYNDRSRAVDIVADRGGIELKARKNITIADNLLSGPDTSKFIVESRVFSPNIPFGTGTKDSVIFPDYTANGQWKKYAISGGGGGSSTLAGLTDVDVSSPTTDDILQFNGTDWTNSDPTDIKNSLALNNVNNTSDANKPVSTAQATAIALKQDIVTTSDNNLTFSSSVISTKKAVQTLMDGATITYDLANGYNAKVTLGGNRTLVISNVQAGQYFTLVVIQDGTGSRTLTLPAGSLVIGGGAGAVTLTTTAAAKDILSAYYDGTNYFWTVGLNYN